MELHRDGLVCLGTGLILIFFMLFGSIGRIASITMIILYAVYLWRLIKAQKKYTSDNKLAKEKTEFQTEETKEKIEELETEEATGKKSINKKTLALVLLGLAGLIIGCRLLIYSGVELARIAGIPEMIMGLFTLAIGTSIPELVVTLSSAMKGLHDLSIGTIVGSNTFQHPYRYRCTRTYRCYSCGKAFTDVRCPCDDFCNCSPFTHDKEEREAYQSFRNNFNGHLHSIRGN